jgi:hypothetical protein
MVGQFFVVGRASLARKNETWASDACPITDYGKLGQAMLALIQEIKK